MIFYFKTNARTICRTEDDAFNGETSSKTFQVYECIYVSYEFCKVLFKIIDAASRMLNTVL